MMSRRLFTSILRQCKDSKKVISLYTINGVKMTGEVDKYDPESLLLIDHDGVGNLIMRSAVSTITGLDKSCAAI